MTLSQFAPVDSATDSKAPSMPALSNVPSDRGLHHGLDVVLVGHVGDHGGRVSTLADDDFRRLFARAAVDIGEQEIRAMA